MKQITPGLSYVGVNDRKTALFEGLWPIPAGVTYNSFIVTGTEKTALIDGVELSEIDALRANIKSVVGNEAPDFLVINHMEPDHSGSLSILHSLFPEMKFVGNSKTLEMARGFYNLPDDALMQVKDGDALDLGGITLRFYLTPMLHWPETMMTYSPELETLFSGDAFGCFGALNGTVVDDRMDPEPYFPEMERYYSNIVGKYGAFVQKALAKLQGLPLKYICSTHGPVWHSCLERVVGIYDRLSRFDGAKGVTIVYGSMYGHTQHMAEVIASELSDLGIKEIRIHDASTTPLSCILADIYRYKGLVIGAPTYNNSLFPPIETLLNAIKNREVKNREVAIFGTFSWGSQAVKRISAMLDECNLLNAELPSVEWKHTAGEAIEQSGRLLARALFDRL